VFDSEPFGQRAVRLGFATSEQVRYALETQRMLSRKSGLIGEIMVEMGWLDEQSYMRIVDELVRGDDESEKDHDELQQDFVRTALERGDISPENIEQARKIRDKFDHKGELIGQIMVELGYITPEECEEILSTYPDDAR